MMNLMVTAIGIGSMMFHGSLTFIGQQADELPMVWHLLLILHFVNLSHGAATTTRVATVSSIALLVYSLIFSAWHVKFKTTTAFQVHFGVLLSLLIGRLIHKYHKLILPPSERRIIYQFLGSGLLGFGFWLFDYHLCAFQKKLPFPFNGHVLWHLFMGIAAYTSIVMLRVLDASEQGIPLTVKYKAFLPFAYRSHRGRAVGQDLTADMSCQNEQNSFKEIL